jgi:hypothetical protein
MLRKKAFAYFICKNLISISGRLLQHFHKTNFEEKNVGHSAREPTSSESIIKLVQTE